MMGFKMIGESAKDVMYTPASLNTDQQARDLYIKSHGMYDAGKRIRILTKRLNWIGEQRKRDYQWPFNPQDHVFGRTEKLVADEGRFCLQPETADKSAFPNTKIVKKNVEDFKDFNADHLGKTKNLA